MSIVIPRRIQLGEPIRIWGNYMEQVPSAGKRLVLVLLLIGWESPARFVNQSQSEVKQNQRNREVTFGTQLKTTVTVTVLVIVTVKHSYFQDALRKLKVTEHDNKEERYIWIGQEYFDWVVIFCNVDRLHHEKLTVCRSPAEGEQFSLASLAQLAVWNKLW